MCLLFLNFCKLITYQQYALILFKPLNFFLSQFTYYSFGKNNKNKVFTNKNQSHLCSGF